MKIKIQVIKEDEVILKAETIETDNPLHLINEAESELGRLERYLKKKYLK